MKVLIYFSAYSYHDIFKQRFYHMLPYLKTEFDQIIIIDGISSYKEKILGLLRNWIKPNRLDLIDECLNVKVFRHYNSIPNRICFYFPFLFNVNYYFLRKSLKSIVSKYVGKNVFVGTSHPYMYNGVLSSFQNVKTFYDCPDLHEEFPWANRDLSIKVERKLIEKVDIFTSSSNFISKIKFEQTQKTASVICNGVSLTDFQENSIDSSIKSKIGYVGALEDWFDYDLLTDLVKNNSNLEFQIIGHIPKSKAELIKKMETTYQNIEFLGHVKHSQLINYLSTWKIGIIPFKINKLIEGVSPIKLFEYCAMGIETVSVHWGELDHYRGYVHTARTNPEFTEMVRKLSNETPTAARVKELSNFAHKHSWENKTKLFVGILENG
jgi:glycosyltransferase involved in cell wall biosynthesis